MEELKAFVHVEVELRYPKYYDYLRSNFESQIYNNSVLLYVRPNSTSSEEQQRIESLLTSAMEQVSLKRKINPKIGKIEFSFADFADLDSDYQQMLKDIPEPFVVLIEP